MVERLTSLGNAKAWLPITTTADDLLVQRLIDGASKFILGQLNRATLLSHAVTEVINGTGSLRQMLRQWPVTSIASLSIDGVAVTASTTPPLGTGYMASLWDGYVPGGLSEIQLVGSAFTRGLSNVSIGYVAGYLVANEAGTIPATPFQLTASAPQGPFAADAGVTLVSTGAAMTKVTGTPTAGQYTINDAGTYSFAAANEGAAVLISYSFIPADIENACFELVGEMFKYRDHIGQSSKSLGGQETVSYSPRVLNDNIKALLQPYRMVVPL